jgi:hypothetical protein
MARYSQGTTSLDTLISTAVIAALSQPPKPANTHALRITRNREGISTHRMCIGVFATLGQQ